MCLCLTPLQLVNEDFRDSNFRDYEGEGANTRAAGVDERGLTLDEFLMGWKLCESKIGNSTAEIEKGTMVTSGNKRQKHAGQDGEVKMQYGRVLERASDYIMDILQVTKDDLVIDLGSGIGQFPIRE